MSNIHPATTTTTESEMKKQQSTFAHLADPPLRQNGADRERPVSFAERLLALQEARASGMTDTAAAIIDAGEKASRLQERNR